MSAPKYKLNYFNACGKAEVIRWILVYADQDFEDHRLEMIDWLRLKPTAPFETLPFLEIDGKTLGGSLSVQRYLAKRFGLAGKDPFEEAQIDSVVEFISGKRTLEKRVTKAVFMEQSVRNDKAGFLFQMQGSNIRLGSPQQSGRKTTKKPTS